jgi:hypothetical protein
MKGIKMTTTIEALVPGDKILVHDIFTIGGVHYFVTATDPRIINRTLLTLLHIDYITREQTVAELVVDNTARFAVTRE